MSPQPKAKPNTQQITLWVDKDLLVRWDAFRREYGVNRSALITTSVNEFIKARSTNTAGGETKAIEELGKQIEQVVSKMQSANLEEDKMVLVHDPVFRSRILKVLEGKPMASKDIAFLLDVDHMVLSKTLVELKRDKILAMNTKEGTWHVLEE